MVIQSSLAVGFHTSTIITGYRPNWSSNEASSVHFTSRRLFQSENLDLNWNNRVPRLIHSCSFITRTNNLFKNRIRASAAAQPKYHPSEEIGDSIIENNEDPELTPAEATRTLIEVNSKATLMFTGLVDNQVHENIFWPDLPYLTDEHGNIYFEVKNDVDVLKTLTSGENYVQVIIGMETKGVFADLGLESAGIDFDMDEIGDEDSDEDDDDGDDDEDNEEGEADDDEDYDSDWDSTTEDDEDEFESDESLGDWAKLETMRSSHPMYFAERMAEATSSAPIDWMEMDQHPAGVVIQGLLRSSIIEENSGIRKQIPDYRSDVTNQAGDVGDDVKDIGINGHEDKSNLKDSSKDGSNQAEELEKDENLRTGTSFYKLEMVKIQLLSAKGDEIAVEVEDFKKVKPDAIAHSASNIISRLKAGGEKTTQALKSLCSRVKGIQVEEVTVVGVDSLGIDLRVCSGTQVQTLRFAFNTRATSEYSAERQLHDLMFPRIHQTPQKPQEAGQKES